MKGDSGLTSPRLRAAGFLLVLLLLCSCATEETISPAVTRPGEAAFNERAGRGEWPIVKIHLEDGEELPFMVDTGTSVTLLDKSLEAKLGKRLGTTTFWNFKVKSKIGIYDAPKLFLGKTQLMTGRKVYTGDFKKLSRETGKPVMGILGMDCLGHYCIQMDFASAKLRFLDPDHPQDKDLGDAFPLKVKGGYPFIHENSFLQKKEINLMVDTGCIFDGLFKASRFPSGVAGQKGVTLATCVWNDNTYTNLFIMKEKPDLIGIRFLARHLVTLDFPRQTMYLKQISIGPLMDKEEEAALKFLKDLKANGQAPGWKPTEKGTITLNAPPVFGTFQFAAQKEGDSSFYYYTVARTSDNGPWKLKKASRADEGGQIVEKYPLP